jgi:hypothetical protein
MERAGDRPIAPTERHPESENLKRLLDVRLYGGS